MNITVEQIKSVYAAANMMKSLNEHTDAKNLMELWETLKEYHKSSVSNIAFPSFEESQGEDVHYMIHGHKQLTYLL